jgi:hypothetical protein
MDGSRKGVKLTKHQQAVLDFCKKEVDEGRHFPTLKTIGAMMGKKESTTNGVRQTLMGITKKGFLIHEKEIGWRIPLVGATRQQMLEMLKELKRDSPPYGTEVWKRVAKMVAESC